MTQAHSRWRLSARSRIVAVLLSAVVAAGTAAAVAAPASASSGHAYLVVNNWHCVGGGNVTAIYGSVDTVWTGGDAGDNIIWPAVRIGGWNTFNGRALCNRPLWQGGAYWINVIWWQFHPNGNNQTFWY